MDILYNKDTLYVDLGDESANIDFEELEIRVDRIMDSYLIERLVVTSRGEPGEHIHNFEWNYNKRHKNKVVVRQR